MFAKPSSSAGSHGSQSGSTGPISWSDDDGQAPAPPSISQPSSSELGNNRYRTLAGALHISFKNSGEPSQTLSSRSVSLNEQCSSSDSGKLTPPTPITTPIANDGLQFLFNYIFPAGQNPVEAGKEHTLLSESRKNSRQKLESQLVVTHFIPDQPKGQQWVKRSRAYQKLTEDQRRYALRNLVKEVEIHRSFEHPNIARFLGIGIIQEENALTLSLFTEYAGLPLDIPKEQKVNAGHEQGKRTVSASTLVNYLSQLASALAYLKSHNILHRDIKPDNLRQQQGVVKLFDFNLSANLLLKSVSSMAGTRGFRAPEVVAGKDQSFPVDMYSSGVSLALLGHEAGLLDYHCPGSRAVPASRKVPQIDLRYPGSAGSQEKLLQTLLSSMTEEVPTLRPTPEQLQSRISSSASTTTKTSPCGTDSLFEQKPHPDELKMRNELAVKA
ncbi:protein kinase domain-containing protein [Parendozoicomonas haliclonae]|uniref:Serine/threonine-protein kinase D n=1 Tax=Parendozoicomonas haliclonae TaxID=1960125 RepID=A0A1X7AKE1_9GAMM|nr:protein kinase [Parendozoicomonas haliclonae]SMA47140.1 Serine/threonine-protein kinase D [Parendozoicomonas haliclonae]